MILVDTSVWIDHFRSTDAALARCLHQGSVLMHPFVLGELALGNLRQRKLILKSLALLPHVTVADQAEIMDFISAANLAGSGIGYIDAHLLAACRLTRPALLWTRDKRLRSVAENLALAVPNRG